MYRKRVEELIKEKKITHKKLSEESGVSVDTIDRIIHPENPDKDSPRVNTLENVCKILGIELWELFYTGDKSLVVLQAEIHTLNTERDALLEENGALKNQVDTLSAKVDSLRDKNDALKDQLIETHNYYIKQKT
jgi:transcriptional regulator with XRE-family HTH domain